MQIKLHLGLAFDFGENSIINEAHSVYWGEQRIERHVDSFVMSLGEKLVNNN